jgi:hypothetical protein
MQSNTISIAALYFSDDKVRTEAVAAHDAKTRFGPLGNESDTAKRKQKPNPGFWKVAMGDGIGQHTRWMGSVRRLMRLVRPFSRADRMPAMAGYWRLAPGEGRSAMRKRTALNHFGKLARGLFLFLARSLKYCQHG